MVLKIKKVIARQILDSRGNPTVEVDIITNYGYSGSGDTVYVSPGTYTENLVIDDKSICMISTNGDPASTIIDGNNDGTAIKIGSWRGMFTLNGFTIQNGNTQNFPYP